MTHAMRSNSQTKVLNPPSDLWRRIYGGGPGTQRYIETSSFDAAVVPAFCRISDYSFIERAETMDSLPLQPIIAILAGILILVQPALLNYVVDLYLIIIGVLGIIGPRRL